MRRRRASVILAVMVVLAIALLVILGMLSMVRGEVAAASMAPRSAQSRALAWSGVMVIGASLDRQRDRILGGERPTLRRQHVLFDDGRLGVVRLLPFGPDGQVLIAEAGKIDLNTVDIERLVGSGLIDETVAESIVAHRNGLPGGRFRSELDLLAVRGVDAELLYGSLDRLLLDPREGIARGPLSTSRGGSIVGLIDAVTVHGIEPALQRSGARRINLNRPWSDELAARVDERFGEGASQGLRTVMQDGQTFESEGRVAEVLTRFGVAPAQWADILDAFTTDDGDLHGGRLDLNSASAEALLSLPGLTPPQAAQIVREREALSAEELAFPTWPMLRGILTAEQFGPIAHRVSSRCWTWRVRIAAGEVDSEDPDGPLMNPIVWEVVIDLTAPAWRVAYLRECTLLPLAAAWNVEGGNDDDGEVELDDDLDESIIATTDVVNVAGNINDEGSDAAIGTPSAPPAHSADPTPSASTPSVGDDLDAASPAGPPAPRSPVGVGRHRP